MMTNDEKIAAAATVAKDAINIANYTISDIDITRQKIMNFLDFLDQHRDKVKKILNDKKEDLLNFDEETIDNNMKNAGEFYSTVVGLSEQYAKNLSELADELWSISKLF